MRGLKGEKDGNAITSVQVNLLKYTKLLSSCSNLESDLDLERSGVELEQSWFSSLNHNRNIEEKQVDQKCKNDKQLQGACLCNRLSLRHERQRKIDSVKCTKTHLQN